MNLVDVVVKGDEFLEGDYEQMYKEATSEKADFVEAESMENVYLS